MFNLWYECIDCGYCADDLFMDVEDSCCEKCGSADIYFNDYGDE